jgi:hypothetical protein
MNDKRKAIRKQTADLLAAEEHILEAIEQQRDDDDLRRHTRVNELVIRIERVLERHTEALEDLLEDYGGDDDLEAKVKKAVSEVFGAAAGLYDRLRDTKLSRVLRDNYTALSLAAMSYTMFHTFGLAVHEEKIARLAEQHLKDLTPLLVEISQVLPDVVAKEMAEEYDFPVDATVAAQATENTQRAWSPKVTESA